MTDLFKLILGILASRFKTRATLEAENLVLRQQVNVLRRRTPRRPHLNNKDAFTINTADSILRHTQAKRLVARASKIVGESGLGPALAPTLRGRIVSHRPRG